MSTFLSIPNDKYESVRSLLDERIGLPNDYFQTSLVPNLNPYTDGNVYVAVPDDYPIDIISEFTIDETTFRATLQKRPTSVEPPVNLDTTTA